jgi:putative DNA primase/helicase
MNFDDFCSEDPDNLQINPLGNNPDNLPVPTNGFALLSPAQTWATKDLGQSNIELSEFCALGGCVLENEEAFIAWLGYVPDCTGHPVVGWYLPFFDPETGKTFHGDDGLPYGRIRMQHPAVDSEGKQAKYLSRSSAGQHAFILPEVHRFLLEKPVAPLILTEGEKKAWCATKAGIPTIGLTGNYGWKIPGTGELLPELLPYLSSPRPILVIWDSDAEGNPGFESSTRQLCIALQKYKCELFELIIPSGASATKVGLDDYRRENGNEKLRTLITTDFRKVYPDRRALTSPENGKLGGRPGEVKEIADFVAKNWIDASGRKTLATYRGSYFQYSGGVYRKTGDEDINAEIMKSIRTFSPDKATPYMLAAVRVNLESADMFHIKSGWEAPCNRHNGERIPQCVCFRNGYLDMEQAVKLIQDGKDVTGGFKDNTPDHFTTTQLPYEFDPKAQCPRFNQFLAEVQPEAQARDVLMKLCGLALVPDTSYNVFFTLYGEGGCGKSVFLEVLRHLVGVENCCCVPLADLQKQFHLVGLTEALLNIIGDMPTDDGRNSHRSVEGMLKDITDGGTIFVEEKFKQGYMAKVIARSIFATNSLPHFSDRTRAMADRMRVIPFKQRFRGTDQEDPHLRSTLIEHELPGIFNLALAQLVELKKLRQFPETEEGRRIKVEHMDRCIIERCFIQERIEQQDGAVLFTEDMYKAFTLYCRASGRPPVSLENFKAELRRQYPDLQEKRIQHIDRRALGWGGIRLISEIVDPVA